MQIVTCPKTLTWCTFSFTLVQNDVDLDKRLVDIMDMILGMCIPSINIIRLGFWKLLMQIVTCPKL